MDTEKPTRFRIYKSRESKNYLCVVAAKDKTRALATARANFGQIIQKTAFTIADDGHLWGF